ncbi:SseB family protein [Glutamicibacter sp. MNS18]|uniref:SseB family protein n=1 Tax=Glutamicibacter sp. MNS18 TaxID=2989817 RepID=UPI0022367936|nr:SseB family protein [Glutamicibacter sp. MNS18]MCW4465360.1 SseB family protein [Glutamicibacter sp. MNS18]
MSTESSQPEPKRHLPGHIVAALAQSGALADSAGQSWEGRDLSGEGNPLHNFDKDDGKADAAVLEALTSLRAGSADESAVHRALANARVFVAVVAQLGEEALTEHGFASDKEADMALIKIKAPDGRMALPVFSTVERLQAWHSEARPVAVYAPRAALSAVSEEAELLVLDPGSEFTFVLRRPGVWNLAKQIPWIPSYQDESLASLVSRATEGHSELLQVRLGPGRGVGSRDAQNNPVPGGGVGPELKLQFTFSHGTSGDRAREITNQIHQTLANTPEFAEAVDSLEIGLLSAPS